jgi:deoxyadenosine/deoxycytidine kinase
MPRVEALELISIEGGIGAGKSSVMAALKASRPSLCYLEEPVEKWERYGLLKPMYNGDIAPATFQLAALATRMEPLLKAVGAGERIVISERCPYSDKEVFTRANLSEKLDVDAYQMAYDALLSALPATVNLHIIYLKADVDLLLARMKVRNRESERVDSEDRARSRVIYLKKLQALHDSFFSATPPQLGVSTVTRHVIDASLPAAEVANAVKSVIANVAPVKLEPIDDEAGAKEVRYHPLEKRRRESAGGGARMTPDC